jgi:hypothetical protein
LAWRQVGRYWKGAETFGSRWQISGRRGALGKRIYCLCAGAQPRAPVNGTYVLMKKDTLRQRTELHEFHPGDMVSKTSADTSKINEESVSTASPVGKCHALLADVVPALVDGDNRADPSAVGPSHLAACAVARFSSPLFPWPSQWRSGSPLAARANTLFYRKAEGSNQRDRMPT